MSLYRYEFVTCEGITVKFNWLVNQTGHGTVLNVLIKLAKCSSGSFALEQEATWVHPSLIVMALKLGLDEPVSYLLRHNSITILFRLYHLYVL